MQLVDSQFNQLPNRVIGRLREVLSYIVEGVYEALELSS